MPLFLFMYDNETIAALLQAQVEYVNRGRLISLLSPTREDLLEKFRRNTYHFMLECLLYEHE